MSDERAREREIQPSPKGMRGRAGRHGLKDYTPYSGRSPDQQLGEVSRGHSSEDAVRKPGEAKGRRVTKQTSKLTSWNAKE